MSDVAPSFFPTPHEIASGVRWVREHPVVATAAAAAATAVSVITFLRARSAFDDDSDDCLVAQQQLDELPPPRQRFSTWNGHYPRRPTPPDELHIDALPPVKSRSVEDFSSHKLEKEAEEIYSNTDSDTSASSRLSRPDATGSLCELGDLDSDDSPRGVNLAPTCLVRDVPQGEEDDDSVSPQWGWYVSTTPPDEYYS
ncbi:hypothetical protein ATCC90586_008393 [Pythium insidiosum]|nr:hypothetical protein ATCC90586_008393 [Pythium insidiosum]